MVQEEVSGAHKILLSKSGEDHVPITIENFSRSWSIIIDAIDSAKAADVNGDGAR